MTISYLDSLADAYGKTFARYVEKALMPKHMEALANMSQDEIDSVFEVAFRRVAVFESDAENTMAREDCADMYAQYAALIKFGNQHNILTIDEILAELD